jgi:hypothetical protein
MMMFTMGWWLTAVMFTMGWWLTAVAKHCCGQVLCHCPHLSHVLVVNQLVEFWDTFGGEKGTV